MGIINKEDLKTDDVMKLVSVSDRIRALESEKQDLKDVIVEYMVNNNLTSLLIPLDGKTSLAVKMYTRVTSSFDKDSIAKDRDIERENLDYIGISKYTDEGIINPSIVEKYISKNESKYIITKVVFTGGGD